MAAEPDDAWTFVKPRSRKTKARGKQHLPPGAQTSASSPAPVKPRTSNLRSVEDIESEYRSVREQWLGSDCCSKLRGLVQRQQPVRKGSVSKAVCMGVGTFDPEDGAWAQKRISFHQLVAFTVMVEELEKMNGCEIRCIHQDPIFTESDTGFLTKLGHTVVESPAAYAEVDQDTFFYGVHLYRPVYAASLGKSLPCIFVGTGYDEWEGATMGSLDDIKSMKKMEDEWTKAAFPEDSIQATFYGTSIYWRPQGKTTPDSATNPTEAEATASNDAKTKTNPEDILVEKLAATTIS